MWTKLINFSCPEKYSNLVKKALDKTDIDALRTCLDEGILPPETVTVNSWTDRKQVLLHEFIYNREFEAVKVLLSRGADVNYPDQDGNTPLHSALSLRSAMWDCDSDPDLIELLLVYGADLLQENDGNITAFDMFARTYIYSKNKDWMDKVSRMLLLYASDIPRSFSGYHIYFQLCRAIVEADCTQVQKILDNSNDFKDFEDVDYAQSILLAEQLDHMEIAKFLIEKIPKLDSVFVPLVERFNIVLVKMILENRHEKNLDINVQDEHGRNAVHYACFKYEPDLLKLLLTETDIDAEIRDKDGYIPMYYALPTDIDSEINIELVRALVELRLINLNATHIHGHPIIDSSHAYCHVLALLCEHGYNHESHGQYSCDPDDECEVIEYAKKIYLIDEDFADEVGTDHFEDSSCWETMKTQNIDEYEKELEQLDDIKIQESSTIFPDLTLFDFMFLEPSEVINCLEDPLVLSYYEKNNKDFRKLFKHYGFILNYQYRKGLRRKSLLDSAMNVLNLAFGTKSPPKINEIIFDNFSIDELKVIGKMVE